MWIAIRVGLALVTLVYTFFSRHQRWRDETVDGLPVRVWRQTHQTWTLLKMRLGGELASPATFRSAPGPKHDPCFKRGGCAAGRETGDQRFDQRFSVIGDHEAFNGLRARSKEARDIVSALYAQHIESVNADGRTLWAIKAAPLFVDVEIVRLLNRLNALLQSLGPEAAFSDRFFWKAAAIEAVIYSIVAYAAGSFAEMVSPPPHHVHVGRLLLFGIAAGLAIAAAGVALVYAIMRGSSRGHRLILESKIVLMLSLPVVGIQTVSDINRGLDTSRSI